MKQYKSCKNNQRKAYLKEEKEEMKEETRGKEREKGEEGRGVVAKEEGKESRGEGLGKKRGGYLLKNLTVH